MLLLTFLMSHCHRTLFPPASRQSSSFLYLRSLLCLVLMTTVLWLSPLPDKVLWVTGSPAHQRQHPRQPGPSPACFQNQQIHRGSHIYCSSLSLHADTIRLLHLITFFFFSLQSHSNLLRQQHLHCLPHAANLETFFGIGDPVRPNSMSTK